MEMNVRLATQTCHTGSIMTSVAGRSFSLCASNNVETERRAHRARQVRPASRPAIVDDEDWAGCTAYKPRIRRLLPNYLGMLWIAALPWLSASLSWAAEENWPGTLAVAQNPDGRLELFKTDTEGALLHRWQKVPNGEWSPWSNLGGKLLPGLAVASDADGRLVVFAVDKAQGKLLCIGQTGLTSRGWTAWKELGRNLLAPVAVGRNSDGRLEVFAIDAGSRSVRAIWQINSPAGWSTWVDLGGAVEPGLVVQRNRDGGMELFGLDARSNALLHCWQNTAISPAHWSVWDNLGGWLQPGFAVGRNADGRLEVFALNRTDSRMERIYQVLTTNGIRWSAWSTFGDALKTGIAVGRNADGRMEVFALNSRHPDVMHRWQKQANGSEDWSAWWSLWGSVQPFPVVGRNQDGNLEIFGVDSTNHSKIQHKRQISANLDWLDWFSMDQPVFPYTSRTWQTEDGLPHNVVRAIAQTPDGYLWIGTQNGLARFDGVRFTVFDAQNTPSMASADVAALCVDHAGSLWIGTEAGLLEWKAGSILQPEGKAPPTGKTIRTLYETRDGALWVGTLHGLDRFENGRVTHFSREDGLASDVIQTVFEDAQTNLWIGTAAGLNRLTGGHIESFGPANPMVENSIRGITQDKGWRVWIGSDNGMIWYNTSQFYAYDRKYGLSDSFVSAVCEDHDGNLWVGTHSGLNRFREGRFFNELKSEGVPYDKVNSIFEDREGILWIGSIEGLIRLIPRRFFTYNTQQGLTHNNTVSVLEDRNGNIWTGTYGGGLDCLRDEQVIAFGKTNGLTQDLILSLCEGRDGSLWIGSDAPGGLFRLQHGEFEHYAVSDGLADSAIRTIHEDRLGKIWLGTDQGLVCYANGAFCRYTAKDHLAGVQVRAICEDHQGQLWFGTDGGLSRWESGRFVNLTTHDGLSDNSITALHVDTQDNLWIGTGTGGLSRYRAGRLTSYTKQQGLFSDEIFEILEDDYGWLWMSCAKGLFRVRKKDFDAVDQRVATVVTSIPYGKSDGMAGTLCNGVAKPAGWKARDGRLWFPTTKGLVVVDPNIRVVETPPPVFIEQLIADDRPAQKTAADSLPPSRGPAKPISIPPGRGELEFDYTALNFQNPENTRFKYLLDGIDSDWVEAGTRRVAHYNNIYPGSYRFRVIACNGDGIWNSTGASLTVLLQPHMWQTWWTRAAAILAILGSVGGAARYVTQKRMQQRLRLLEQQSAIERERGRIAKDIHDELGSSLTRIVMLGLRTHEDIAHPDKLAVHTDKIVSSARKAVQSLDEIVWAVNPENDTLDGLVGYLNQFGTQFFEGTGVRCRLELPAKLPSLILPAELRHALFLVVKEAMNNVLKHAQASETRIKASESGGLVEIVIEDNGCGFDPLAGGGGRKGNGLANMGKRMAAIGGGFIVHSLPGRGTQLRFTVKVDASPAVA